MGESLAPFPSCRGRLCFPCPCEVTWVRFPLLSMGWALLLSRCFHRSPRIWLHLQEPDSCRSRAAYICLSEMYIPPMKGMFHRRHLEFFLHQQWTSVISISGRCHNRTSHWKGAVTLIPTCLCQMLILPSFLFFRTLYEIPNVSMKPLFVVLSKQGSALHRIGRRFFPRLGTIRWSLN